MQSGANRLKSSISLKQAVANLIRTPLYKLLKTAQNTLLEVKLRTFSLCDSCQTNLWFKWG